MLCIFRSGVWEAIWKSAAVLRVYARCSSKLWNVCHPDVSAVHLFVEDDGGRAFMQRHMHERHESPLIDMCSKVVFHNIGHTMHYRDAVKLSACMGSLC